MINNVKVFFKKDLVKQILKFAICGGTAFIIDYGVFIVLTQVFKIYYLIASIISFTISVIYNYILSIKWVFKAKKQNVKEFFIFVVLSIIGLGINSLIMYIFVDLISIHELISKVIATIIVMIYNFITRKIFVEEK